MCRFLIVKSQKAFNPNRFLEDFANMAEKSRTVENDKQEDGWGVAWHQEGAWKIKKYLKPIWKNRELFKEIKNTKLLVVHARSSSFESHKDNLEFNQPFIEGPLAFVFNGMVIGVAFEKKIDGKIGAQKIFNLIRESGKSDLEESLLSIHHLMKNSSRKIKGLNIGLATGNRIAALCAYGQDKKYFTLHHHNSNDLSIIASEPVGDFDFEPMKDGQVKVF